jgi:predicted nucleic-acid-binding Zn-ribbon protein
LVEDPRRPGGGFFILTQLNIKMLVFVGCLECGYDMFFKPEVWGESISKIFMVK